MNEHNEIQKLILDIVVLIIAIFFYRKYFYSPWNDMLKMGNMKTWWIFGFEWWGGCKPFRMMKGNKVFKPIILGLWIEDKTEAK